MAIANDPIKVDGLTEFVRALKRIEGTHPKAMRLAFNETGKIIVSWAQPRVARKSGRAARSIRATSTPQHGKVSGYGARVPYGPWLDFGGRVGKKRSVRREFIPSGRYIYPGYAANVDQIEDELLGQLVAVVEQAGLAVENG
ncbi:MAG TPA: hypothetical protein VGX25_35390 [Actinophytocola sp.]|uniref:hypothetical protein n=1 Tax=Actinophytocola sp. TaxID=1872138 RepID=UPI002DDDA0CC|nr:hypothetical protein [Actinophytocola sp.]HEV2784699.1 hypothetical protein [Actinophytocola sp.]